MPKDILLDTDFDLKIVDGDLVIGESTEQSQQLLLLIEKGELREYPTRCVGVQQWLNDDSPGDLNAEIKREYEADGMKVFTVKGSGLNVKVNAEYGY